MDAHKIKEAELKLLSALSPALGRRVAIYEDRYGHRFDIIHYDKYRVALRCQTCHYCLGMNRGSLKYYEDARFGEFHCNDTAIEELLDSVGPIPGVTRGNPLKEFSTQIIEPE